jgi:hypothetical protein
MTITSTKPQFLTESLIEVLNNEWKVNAIESGRHVYHQLEHEVGRKYIKIWEDWKLPCSKSKRSKTKEKPTKKRN